MSICNKLLAGVVAASVWAAAALGAMDDGIKVFVKGLVCAYCAQGLTRTVKKHPFVDELEVDVGKGVMVVKLKPGKTLSAKDFAALVADAGFVMDHVEYPMDDM
jgi:mercuric ion binding protein